MSDYTTNASVNLTMNGEQPKQVLEELRKRAFNLENAIAKAASAGNKTELTKLRKELKTTQRQIREMESATMQVEKVLKQLDKATPKELQRTLKTLEKQLNNLERGSEAWKRQTEYIKRVRAEIDKVNRELRNGETFWERFNRKMNDWQTTLAAGVAAVTGLIMAFRRAVSSYAEMEEQMANTLKYTGMSKDQVKQLNDAFLKMDTRTPREKLNELAQEAGRLGKNTLESVQGYVEAADIINVALVDLGSGATQTIAKISNIFGVEEMLGTKDAMLSVGSTVNVLSQNCTASKPYIVEFTQRMAGVGAQAKLTIPEIMAFAATLDANGQKVEMSASALSRLIMMLFQKPKEIAQQVGLDVQKFTETLNKSTNEGVLMFLEQLKSIGDKDALAALAPLFKDLGMDGIRMSQVLANLASHLDMVKWEQEEANKAFKEATSATREYNIFNNTVQAGLEKAKNHIHELAVELGEKMLPLMKYIMTSSTAFLKALNLLVDFIIKYKGEIIVVTASIVAYTIAVNVAAIKTKAFAVAQGVAKVATVAWTVVTQAAAVVTALFTGKLHKAKIEFMIFSALLKASPIGLLVASITAVVGGLLLLTKRTDAATESQKMLNKIREDAKVKMADEKTQIELLITAAKNEKLTLDERKKAIDKLNSIIPNYNAQLDITTGKYVANKKALDDYLLSLAKMYEIEGAKDQLAEIGRKTAKLKTERAETEKALDDAKKRTSSSSTGGGTPTPQTSGGAYAPRSYHASIGNSGEIAALESKLSDIDDDIRIEEQKRSTIFNVYGDDLQKEVINAPVITNPTNPNPTIITPTTTTPSDDDVDNANEDRFKVEKEWREREEALNRIAYAKGEKSFIDYTKRMNQIEVEFYNKQLAHTDLSENERLSIQAQYYEAVKKQNEANTNFTLDAEKQSYNERLAEAKQFFVDGKYSIDTYNEAVARIEEEHLRNMVTLTKEGTKERMDAEKALADFQYQAALKKQQELKKQQDAIKKSQDDLKNEYFGLNANERKNAYDNDLANLKIVYEAELAATQGNAEEKLRIEEAYQQAKLALQKKYGFLAVEDNRNALELANAELAEWLESEAGKAVMQSFDTVMSGMGAIFSQVSSIVQSELEIQTAAIEKRYDKEISLAEGNSYKVAKLEKQKEKEIAKAKNEANKKMFAMQVIQAIAQTATNAINAYGSAAAIPVVGFVMAPIAAAMAVAAGALQIAAIKRQQQASESQGYAKGGFTPKGAVDEEVGVVHAGEWVASQKLLANPVARPLINALDYAQRTNTIGSLRSADVSRAGAPQVVAQSAPTIVVEPNGEYTYIMKRLAERLDEPFVTVNTITGDNGIKKAQDEYDKLIRNKTPKSKRK